MESSSTPLVLEDLILESLSVQLVLRMLVKMVWCMLLIVTNDCVLVFQQDGQFIQQFGKDVLECQLV